MHVLLRHSSIPAKTDAIASGRFAKGKVVLKKLLYFSVIAEKKIIAWLVIVALT